MKSIFIVLFAAVCGQTAIAQHAQNIPQQAKDAFAKSYTGVSKVKWEKEGAQYEASFVYQSHKMSVLYKNDGTLVETETAIEVKDLPDAARKYAMAKGKIKEAARIVQANGTVEYEAEVNGKDLLFDSKGAFLSEKQD